MAWKIQRRDCCSVSYIQLRTKRNTQRWVKRKKKADQDISLSNVWLNYGNYCTRILHMLKFMQTHIVTKQLMETKISKTSKHKRIVFSLGSLCMMDCVSQVFTMSVYTCPNLICFQEYQLLTNARDKTLGKMDLDHAR